MNNWTLRDELGRVLGGLSYWFNEDETESYTDEKCYNVRFPVSDRAPSEVIIWNINDAK